MKKRKLLKSALAGSLMSTWIPPVITAISLPAHASTTSASCNDIQWQPGIQIISSCDVDHMFIPMVLALFSETLYDDIDGTRYYSGEILGVYSTNPVHKITWTWQGAVYIDIIIREPLPKNCTGEAPYFTIESLSPGTLFIVTECGSVSIPLGTV